MGDVGEKLQRLRLATDSDFGLCICGRLDVAVARTGGGGVTSMDGLRG